MPCVRTSKTGPGHHRANGGRWIIENGFRIMKTDFDARGMREKDDHIKAHFLTCFLALLVYKYLEESEPWREALHNR